MKTLSRSIEDLSAFVRAVYLTSLLIPTGGLFYICLNFVVFIAISSSPLLEYICQKQFVQSNNKYIIL